MRTRRATALWSLGVFLAVGMGAGEARATTGTVTPVTIDSHGPLTETLEQELASMKGVTVTARNRARYVVRGNITRLEREPEGASSASVRCEVSIVIEERRGGSIRVMLSGRATARGGRSDESLERFALEGAVRGALRPLPGSLGR